MVASIELPQSRLENAEASIADRLEVTERTYGIPGSPATVDATGETRPWTVGLLSSYTAAGDADREQ